MNGLGDAVLGDMIAPGKRGIKTNVIIMCCHVAVLSGLRVCGQYIPMMGYMKEDGLALLSSQFSLTH